MSEVIFFTRQEDFSDWLASHPDATELWVGYYKKNAASKSPTWSETVDVALCHGWIDGIRKTIDDTRYKIRFTPRKPDSRWSAINVEKARRLIEEGKMTPAGLELFRNRRDVKGYSTEDRNVPLAREYEDQIRANARAWAFFCDLAPSIKRDSIWWIMSAKRESTRAKRLRILIESSEEGLKIPPLRTSA